MRHSNINKIILLLALFSSQSFAQGIRVPGPGGAIPVASNITAGPATSEASSVSNGNGNSVATLTPLDTSTSGGVKLVVVCEASYQLGAGGAITDTYGNTYTPLTANSSAGLNEAHGFYTINPTTGAAHYFTDTNAGGFPSIWVQTFYSATGGFDQENGNHGTSTTPTSGSVTPTVDNEVVVSCLANDSARTITLPSGFTGIDNAIQTSNTVNWYGWASYIIQTTATTVNPTWAAANVGFASTVATFKKTP